MNLLKRIKRSSEPDFFQAIKDKKIPIVTLDRRWHELFTENKKTAQVKKLENRVNTLMKQQARYVKDAKELKKLKKKLMQEIVENMGDEGVQNETIRTKKMEQNQKLIKEMNQKLEQLDMQLEEIPKEIKSANEELLMESMRVSYITLNKNKQEIDELTSWIEIARAQLKEKVLHKQEMELNNSAIYSYMHDLLGAEVIEIFDSKQEEI